MDDYPSHSCRQRQQPLQRRPQVFSGCRSLMLLAALCVQTASAQIVTQEVQLQAGWNSVWLEVEPVYAVGDTVRNIVADPDDDEVLSADDSRVGQAKAPQDVFTDASIERLATPKELASLAEFFGNQTVGSTLYNQADWELYLRDDPAELTDLVMVRGVRPYLIHVADSTDSFALQISGTARFYRPNWVPDRYNLIGFGMVDSVSFQDFFAASGGTHPVSQIYALAANGNWAVVNPSDSIATNTAYWIFSAGPSDYMGPVAVDFDGAAIGELSYGGPGDVLSVDVAPDDLLLDLEELVFTNLDPTVSATPELELMTADPGNGTLELHVVHPEPDSLRFMRGNQIDSVANDGQRAALGETVAPESTAVLSLGALRNWSSGTVGRTNLYRLHTGGGNAVWLPISANQGTLQNAADLLPESETASVAGLWIGEVSVDGVSSIVENGAPVRPTNGVAPLRLIVHSDQNGAVRLLSQVTLMQTKSADPEIAPQPVLVVDPAQMPYFEGIEERDGKRVGLRIESVAYDMPRKWTVSAQADLVAKAAAAVPSVTLATDTDVLNYVLSSSLRPSTLQEDYHLTHALEGVLGSGKTLRTASSNPLLLDPFHRSNPFRHAYHPQHARGSHVSRELEILFDAEQLIADRLSGSYQETLRGVTKSDLILSGEVVFRRLSTVVDLEGTL